jgi:hypothetical protein
MPEAVLPLDSSQSPEGNSSITSRLPRSPFVIAAVFMAFRLASPNFDFIDDGVTLRYGRELTASARSLLIAFTAISDTGRFIPVYWLYYGFVYWIGWANALIFLLTNAVALIVTTACIVSFVKYRGGSHLQAGAAGILFVLSAPTLETYYTNSQEGVPQFIFIGVALVLLASYSSATTPLRRRLIAVAMFFAFLAANCSMETSVVMSAVALGWLVSRWIPLTAAGDRMTSGSQNLMLVTSAAAAASWFLLRSALLHMPLFGGTYTAAYKLELHQILATSSLWLSQLFRDFPYLLPLAIPVLLLTVRRRQPQARLIVDSLIWIAGWIAIYLPWHSVLEHYMFPCAVGCAIVGGVAVGQMRDMLVDGGSRKIRVAAYCAVALFVVTCVNNWTNGRYQITMDNANMALVDFLSSLPPYSRVLVNIREPNEYEYEIGVHLTELKKRPDISVDYFRLQTASATDRDALYYVVTPIVRNEPHPSVPYALYEGGATEWTTALEDFIGISPDLVYDGEYHMRLADIGIQRLLCMLLPSGAYCEAPRPVLDGRLLTYGWQVYRVSRQVADLPRPARFLLDGTWLLQTASGSVRRIHFGEEGDQPIVGDWTGNGSSGIGVYRPGNKTWYLDFDRDGRPDLVFRWDAMEAGDIPVVGDWNGHGRAGPGYFRPQDATWHLLDRFENTDDVVVLTFGMPNDMPIVGDWDGDGRQSVGVYRKAGRVFYQNALQTGAVQFTYAAPPQAMPVVARWSGNGRDSVAFVAGESWTPRYVSSPEEPSNPAPSFNFGPKEAWPLAGKWK